MNQIHIFTLRKIQRQITQNSTVPWPSPRSRHVIWSHLKDRICGISTNLNWCPLWRRLTRSWKSNGQWILWHPFYWKNNRVGISFCCNKFGLIYTKYPIFYKLYTRIEFQLRPQSTKGQIRKGSNKKTISGLEYPNSLWRTSLQSQVLYQ